MPADRLSARLGMLQSDVKVKRYPQAYRNLNAALGDEDSLREEPTRDEVRRRLIFIELQMGAYPAARQHILTMIKESEERLKAATDEPSRRTIQKDIGELFDWKAQCDLGLREQNAAVTSLQAAVRIAP